VKKTILTTILGLIFSISIYSQTTPKFNLTKDGVQPVVLTFDETFTASKIYSKAKSWNATMADYPASVIRIDKENTQLKFGGYIEKAWKIRDNDFDSWFPMKYTMNVEIKDGRCRVTFESSENNYKVWYNTDGSTIKRFLVSESSFETAINKLLSSLYTYIKAVPKKTDDNW
jgi:hypothetical protein